MDSTDQVFWLGFIGAIIGFLGLTLKMCLKSKCDIIEIGCLKIHRNVEIEEKLDELELTRSPTDSSTHV